MEESRDSESLRLHYVEVTINERVTCQVTLRVFHENMNQVFENTNKTGLK